MYISKEVKEEYLQKHGKSEKDTGSPEGQIAFFTHRINTFIGSPKNKP